MDSYLITDEVCVYYFTLLKRLLILENSRTGLAKMECRGGLEFSFVMSRKCRLQPTDWAEWALVSGLLNCVRNNKSIKYTSANQQVGLSFSAFALFLGGAAVGVWVVVFG